MVTMTLHCPHCQSEALVRNGHAPNGKQLVNSANVRRFLARNMGNWRQC